MYFAKKMRKIKRVLKDENIQVASSENLKEKVTLKFVTYELENGQRSNSVIDTRYINSIREARKFLAKFRLISDNIENTNYNNEYRDLANDIRLEYERGNSLAPISVCGMYATKAIKYEKEYYKALELVDYCFATGKNIEELSSDERTCWVVSHIYDIGNTIDINSLNVMTITNNLLAQTSTKASLYMPSKLSKEDTLNGTEASMRLITCLLSGEKSAEDFTLVEAIYGKDAIDASKEVF